VIARQSVFAEGTISKMNLRERFLDEVIGDVEHHPKRGLVYLALGTGALSFWAFGPADDRLAVVPLVFASGGAILVLKGMFLFRKSSEGLAPLPSRIDVVAVAAPPTPKTLPPIPALSAQAVQDFGAGGVLIAPILHFLNESNQTGEFPALALFLTGAALFLAGWCFRRLLASESAAG
jgi:hypothetical protein